MRKNSEKAPRVPGQRRTELPITPREGDLVRCMVARYQTLDFLEDYKVKKVTKSTNGKNTLLTLLTKQGKMFVPLFITYKAANFAVIREGEGKLGLTQATKDKLDSEAKTKYLVFPKGNFLGKPVLADNEVRLNEIVDNLLRGNPKVVYSVFTLTAEASLPHLPVEWKLFENSGEAEGI